MKRVLFSDNGTLIDFTTALNNYVSASKTFNYTLSQDALYIGSKMAFNHLYFKLSTLNIVAATMTIEYWNGQAWTPSVETIDETSGFTASGFVTWTPSKQSRWQMSSTSTEGQAITGLETVAIYDQYWIKITFSATLTTSTAIAWVGNLFSNDDDLASEYPDTARSVMKTSFVSGKTTWEEQHVKAAEILAQDLVNKGIIFETGQILNREDYRASATMKTAEIIFRALGDDYTDQRQQAREEYQLRLSKNIHAVDSNADAIEQVIERRQESGWGTR